MPIPYALDRGDEFIVVNKPAGFSTHAVDTGIPGLAEITELELSKHAIVQKIHVVHRLDKTTTGVLFFATTPVMAAKATEIFRVQAARKRYLFISKSHIAQETAEAHSNIEKAGALFKNTPCAAKDAAAHTKFRRVKLNALFELWEAFPETGKSHQVRLHAAQIGLPILGDVAYGGAEYPHLCLHAAELELPGIGKWTAPAPIFFDRLGLARDVQLAVLLSAMDRRQRLFDFLNHRDQALRLSHVEDEDYRVDLFGEHMWVYWYRPKPPIPAEVARFEFAAGLASRKLTIRQMQNRGEDPNKKENFSADATPDATDWPFTEGPLRFIGRAAQGLSPGLFLDQRENRMWMSANARGKKVLNLFAYTCGFSVAAAVGGAHEVVSVDLSKNFIEWGKANFQANDLAPHSTEPLFQFFTLDSQQFLKGTIKRGRKFDIIVCDPPSFSRNGKDIWKIESGFPELLKMLWACLASGGTILCSTNYEKWTAEEFAEVLQKNSPRGTLVQAPTGLPWDFETPKEPRLMKSFFLTMDPSKNKRGAV